MNPIPTLTSRGMIELDGVGREISPEIIIVRAVFNPALAPVFIVLISLRFFLRLSLPDFNEATKDFKELFSPVLFPSPLPRAGKTGT